MSIQIKSVDSDVICQVSFEILQDIIRKGRLDYQYAMNCIKDLTQSESVHYFTTLGKSNVLCQYTDSKEYEIGSTYDSYKDTPENAIGIMENTKQIAMFSLSNLGDIGWYKLDARMREHLLEVLAMGQIINNMKESRFTVVYDALNALKGIIVSARNPQIPPVSMASLTRDLGKIVVAVQEYIIIESDNYKTSPNIVNLETMITGIASSINEIKIIPRIDPKVPRELLLDGAKIENLIYRTLLNLVNVPLVNLEVALSPYNSPDDYQVSFWIYSIDSSINERIESTFSQPEPSLKNLGAYVVSQWCSLLGGYMSVDMYGRGRTGVYLIVQAHLPSDFVKIKGKRVLVGMSEMRMAQIIMTELSDVNAFATWESNQNSVQAIKWDAVILDSQFPNVAHLAATKGVPVVWVQTQANLKERTFMERYAKAVVPLPLEKNESIVALASCF